MPNYEVLQLWSYKTTFFKLLYQSPKKGGKEHDLQIWDLNKIESGPVFRAKNVPTDSLQLRVPIWITDMCFPDNLTKDKVAIVSR